MSDIEKYLAELKAMPSYGWTVGLILEVETLMRERDYYAQTAKDLYPTLLAASTGFKRGEEAALQEASDTLAVLNRVKNWLSDLDATVKEKLPELHDLEKILDDVSTEKVDGTELFQWGQKMVDLIEEGETVEIPDLEDALKIMRRMRHG